MVRATKKPINVLVLLDEKHTQMFKTLENYWQRFLHLEVIHDQPENIDKYIDKPFEVLFLDAASYKKFNLEYYNTWQQQTKNFLYVVVADEMKPTDVDIYKALADQILYLNQSKELLEWNSFSILRRFWNVSSKDTTIIYREIIADFIEQTVTVNQERVVLSPKEYAVLKFLMQHRGQWVAKDIIFKEIWKTGIKDTTYVLNQVIHRLMKKIGTKYFSIQRSLGVRFE